ncbi:ATP phosphoribosyltransferase regulatory subunit [Leptolyngbya sp. FACHB-261]|uniref:ATP phosphoribosyltransferase regulatory subunit n=1 Tax=Leptolyngbya sp. FACHB-261 TaxID=2692806 RepID=UPI001685DF55|nr:ATP phosphoribosyltransferase regulatory subunit [Leptolyngbya sp. FACHB-261]MBD2104634.1 ATP phosphoribosyltransferase regulatory subunit [Leptolyngbya sp. FACHB-261]
MIHQPPAGSRDLLPLDVVQKRWIEQRLQQVFSAWNYHQIITPTLERLDTLTAGGALQSHTVMQLRDGEGQTLGLRPELTASIARAAVTRMAGATLPLRLYYNANVFRPLRSSSYPGPQESFQSGVELLGGGGLVADAEVLLLLRDCLENLGVAQSGWSLILGEAGLTQALLSGFPEAVRETVRQAIAGLDRVSLETMPLDPALRQRALFLLELRGEPAEVLARLAALDLAPRERGLLNRLKALVELLEGVPLVLDLSLIQTFDYYTGIVFEVVSGTHLLGQGGRYDQLLNLYAPEREPCPGIGFVLNLEELHSWLLATGQLPERVPIADWLVVPLTPEAYATAFSHAALLRAAQLRVELDLHQRPPEEVRAYARRRRIAKLAWVSGPDTIKLEHVEGSEP